ncbi:MAG: polysaccharide deacetylase family protein [Gemmatimonadaceae bacterium]|nr:polysaccharide deacetylase family protein [Gemmatimonadaceae bacterium]
MRNASDQPQRIQALMYHDVVAGPDSHRSGFSGSDADHYKVEPGIFSLHLQILRRHAPDAILTFDDGGRTALEPICSLLEQYGYRGHFFIPTSFINTPRFCSASDLREIAARGHHIGSHSHSHPIPISKLSTVELDKEWRTSREILQDVLGAPVNEASIPGGFSTRRVVAAVRKVGYLQIFTSVPTRTPTIDGATQLIGRFAVTRSTSLGTIDRIARGNDLPWRLANFEWRIKQALKILGGSLWYQLRERVFEYHKT